MPRYRLTRSNNGYALLDELSTQSSLRIDFTSGQLQQRRLRGGKKELLLKAVNAKPDSTVWDCTGGLGTDSLLLASAGCQVSIFERSPIMHLLLEQAIFEASQDPELAMIVARMQLVKTDASTWLGNTLGAPPNACNAPPNACHAPPNACHAPPDVIYLDPMFPKRKKSARVNGAMQMLQGFVGVDEDVVKLFSAAKRTQCQRIVVKRPVADFLDLGKPDFSLSAKSNRFDVFLQKYE